MTERLTGSKLLETVNELNLQHVSKSDQCRICGYVTEKEDGTERFCFTEFYTQLIEARGVIVQNEVEEEWVQLLSEEDKLLLDEIRSSGIRDCTEELLEEIKDLGIETPDQFNDSYQGCWDGWNGESEFTKQFYEDIGEIDPNSTLFDFIDWDLVWNCNLRHDFTVIDGVYFFSDNF